MNGKDIFLGLKYVGDDLIEKAEYGSFPTKAEKTEKRERRRLTLRRPMLVAAMIALMLLLVGCAVVYVLSMEKVKIGETTETRDYRLVEGTYVEDPHEVSQNVLTLAGLEGSKAYQACAEFYAFKEDFTQDMNAKMESGTLPENFFEENTYSKTMDAKAVELAQQYGLKLEGEPLDFRTARNMCEALGIERFLRDSQDLVAIIDGGACYENGNFWMDVEISFPENKGYEVLSTSGVLRWNRTDCFSRDYVSLVDSGDWTERNYTTVYGTEVLILYSPSQERGYIICDRGEALMTLQLYMNIEVLSEIDGVVSAEYQRMTEKQIEMIADTMDFSIHPKVATQEDVEKQPGAPVAATQNGYTLTLKSVETDGYVVHILVGVTAPEGTDIESIHIDVGNYGNLTPVSGQMWGSSHISSISDNDGLSNTKDLLLVTRFNSDNGTMPCAEGSSWNLSILDLWADKHYDTERILVEGEWTFPITFDETNSDYREIEFISEPIQAKACYGWGEDGTDAVTEFTVTSFKLRKFSSQFTWDLIPDFHGSKNFGASADFYGWVGDAGYQSAYVVMKDGSKIELPLYDEPVDLDRVDHVLLADGTKLMVPEA